MDELIKVSRSSFLNKVFDVSESEVREKFSGKDLEEALALLPTKEELEFKRIFESTAPELERLRRKISVCLLAEVTELTSEKVEYLFNDKTVTVLSPSNSYNVFEKLQESRLAALQEMVKQGCVKSNGVDVDINKMAIDELGLLNLVVDRFFFQIYLMV